MASGGSDRNAEDALSKLLQRAVNNNVGDQEDPNVNDKQEVKKADDQEIKNVKDKEGKNVKDQQVSEGMYDSQHWMILALLRTILKMSTVDIPVVVAEMTVFALPLNSESGIA
ncbi:hypothetical protein Tco_1055017, partial [Tanacetum coccineum]